MAKKDKRGVNTASILFADATDTGEAHGVQIDSHTHASKQKGFRSKLSGGRIGVIAAILFVTLGAFGAGLKYLEDSAKGQTANLNESSDRQSSGSYLSTLNPFMPNPTPSPTPLPLSKEYIYAGSRMLAVEDANANAAPPADLAVWRPSTGYWYVMGGTGSQQTTFLWGGADDKPVPGDYDGDGKTDFSVFRRANGYWYVSNSSSGSTTERYFGAYNDKPAPADYDGDGRTDTGVYRPSEGKWYIYQSSDQATVSYTYGGSGDIPVPADYDGDGKADIAFWHNLTGQTTAEFHILKSTSNYLTAMIITFPFSHLNDRPVPGDYDGDGKADAAVWRKASPYQYQWHVHYSATQAIQAVASLGDPDTDKAVQNDYDGDGKVDMAIWRPSTGMWHIRQSASGQPRDVQWGMNGDEPVPAFYRR